MKTRIISALVVIAIFVPIIYLGGYVFAGAMGILSILAYKEILDLKKSHSNYPIFIKVIGLLSLLYLVLGNLNINSLENINFAKILMPIVFLIIPTVFFQKDKYQTKDAFYLIGWVCLIGILFNLLIAIRNINIYVLIYLLSVTILTDTFAYAIGRLIGKHKMCEKISPNKSWEGAIAGLIGGVVISVIIYSNLIAPFSIRLLFVTLLLSIVGQLGDLVYSKIKRENEIKDFSNIMPGHGGVLDRVDSLTFVTFVYIILIHFL